VRCSVVNTAVFDIELRSVINLEVAGVSRYARDPSTEILCVGYAIDDGKPKIWKPGDPLPNDLFAADEFVAHNFPFERSIWTHILTSRHDWPTIPPLSKQRCTMTMALAAALPAALDNLAKALDLPFNKDVEGYRLMRKMSRPRRPYKDEDPNGIYWIDGLELRERLHQYCKHDVETERAAYRCLPPLSPEEQVLWELDAIINERGIFTDVPLTVAARDLARAEQAAVNAEIAKLTGGEITTVSQTERIKEFIRQHGHTIETLTQRSVSQILRHDPSDVVRQLLDLRLTGARASTKKFDALLASVDADGRLRQTLRFHGSSTGRWSGTKFQPQNLKKPKTKDLDAAITAILGGDIAKVRELGAPLTVAGDVSRAAICAASGHKLMGGDLSSIESRILAWIAGERWKIENYRKYDETGDPKFENYCVLASRALKRTVTPDDENGRGFGKINDLAFGFGGGLGAWRRFDDSDRYSDGEIEHFKEEFRRTHPATIDFWHRLEQAAHRAVITGQKISSAKYRVAWEMENGTLLLTLPSGRRISYPEAKVVPGKFDGTYALRYKDSAKGRWADYDAWYGALVENAVQAIARDILAAAMRRIEAAGYPIVLTVHDEIVCEVPEGFGNLEEFHRLMVELPPWAGGLPLAAKVWTRPRYAKTTIVADKPSVLPLEPISATTPIAILPPELEIDTKTEVDAVEIKAGIDDGDEDPELTEALATVPLTELVTESLTSGMLCCPFHDDSTPSCRIYDDHYYCFGCGARGSQLDWLMAAEGMDRDAAIKLLKAWDGPPVERAPKPDKAETCARALRLWGEAMPIAGTLAARYLADTRGINLTELPTDVDAVLRFHPRCPFNGSFHPCLIALMRDVLTDEPTGIHRIALTPDARKIERRMLGKVGAVKLWRAGWQLVIGEGIETVLAAATCILYENAALRPAWALTSTGPFAQFPVIADVERLILLIDHDDEGIAAANACTERWTRARRTVVKLMPDEAGADFNDLIMPENGNA
jgi:Toprim domain/DNA polymerase family A/CHC2 zinc finger